MPRPDAPLSSVLPPLICGTATFNIQYNADPFSVPANEIVYQALSAGVRAFDSSPYYGPSESILGNALNAAPVREKFRRQDYFILTKCGRIAADEFDYSAEWVRKSVQRSLARLHTTYLDVVYCHDVEFVSAAEVLEAVRELRRLRDTDGSIRYIGISGYPVELLAELAELVLRETGEPLDVVMSYCNFTLQNTTLLTKALPRLLAAGVDVVPNASALSMGLLRTSGVPHGAAGDWHPAPPGLRRACAVASELCQRRGTRLEHVAIRYALDRWLRDGAAAGARGDPRSAVVAQPAPTPSRAKLGVSVIGVSNTTELDEMLQVWRDVLAGGPPDAQLLLDVQSIWDVLGDWRDYTWASPPLGYVNVRKSL